LSVLLGEPQSVYKRVLEIPTLDIVVSDFNLKGILSDDEWIDTSSSSIGGTTLRSDGTTTTNSYDKVLIRKGAGIRVIDVNVFKIEVKSFSVSDHHCVSTVIGKVSGGDSARIS